MKYTVASWHWWHLTTCCSRLFDISIIAWHTRQVTIGTPPCGNCWYGGGNSPGPIGETVVCSSLTFGYIVSASRKKIKKIKFLLGIYLVVSTQTAVLIHRHYTEWKKKPNRRSQHIYVYVLCICIYVIS